MMMPYPYPPRPVFSTAGDNECKLHIADLHESITEEILWKVFKQYGAIS